MVLPMLYVTIVPVGIPKVVVAVAAAAATTTTTITAIGFDLTLGGTYNRRLYPCNSKPDSVPNRAASNIAAPRAVV